MQLPGGLERRQPSGRYLVGRTEVRTAALAQTVRRAFQHQPHRGAHGSQPLQFGAVHDARVEVRQQAGLLQHQPGHALQVFQCARRAQTLQGLAGHAVARLGFVPQREQRFLALRRLTGARDRQDLIGRQIGALEAARCLGEGAVVAHVAAQLGERYEDLA